MFLLIRHGESTHNVGEFFSSQPDHQNYKESHLTTKGQDQIKCLAKDLKEYFEDPVENITTHFFSSPLPRTIETSTILCQELGWDPKKIIKESPELIEVQAGDMEGKTYQHMKEVYGVDDCWDVDAGHEKWNGESTESIERRIEKFIIENVKDTVWEDDDDDDKKDEKKDDEKHLYIIVSHGSILLKFIEYVQNSETKTDRPLLYRISPGDAAFLTQKGHILPLE